MSKRFASRNYLRSSVALLQERMETNDERRKRRLEQICALNGGVRVVAERASVSWATLDQILKGALLPPKEDGSRSPRSLGDENARAIERAFHLGRGWFDWPFDAVDMRLYYSLSEVERGAVQGAMNAAIKDIAERKAKAVMRKMGARKEALSDADVESKIPATRTKAATHADEVIRRARVPVRPMSKTAKKTG